MGRIAILASGLKADDTPLSKDISRFLSAITIVSVFFGLLFSGEKKIRNFILFNFLYISKKRFFETSPELFID
jgi:hypothetical protein